MGSRPPGFCQNQKSWLIDAGEDTEIAFVGGSISIHIPWLLVAGGDRAARAICPCPSEFQTGGAMPSFRFRGQLNGGVAQRASVSRR
jgi:hypothetical protein